VSAGKGEPFVQTLDEVLLSDGRRYPLPHERRVVYDMVCQILLEHGIMRSGDLLIIEHREERERPIYVSPTGLEVRLP
jgi:hypothetical protein